MPGYIVKQLQQYKHASPTRPRHCSFYRQPKHCGSTAQRPIKPGMPPPFSKEDIKQVNALLGESSITHEPSTSPSTYGPQHDCKQTSKGTKLTIKKANSSLITLPPIPMQQYDFTLQT
jgi:hypothetical protein